jgi:meiotically up-regulated gene 157 (Mug157) protein
MGRIVATMRVQQRKHGQGPYRFQRLDESPTETLPNNGFGSPVNPVGLVASGFRPSDDACTFPFLVPANLFAVTSLRQLAEMAHIVLKDDALANEAHSLAQEIDQALHAHGTALTKAGEVWAYEVDGFGSTLLMDDANVPSLLSLPYLCNLDDTSLYSRTRNFAWSSYNPWFFRGSAGEGVGSPHTGIDLIWPLSQMTYALTSNSDEDIRMILRLLKVSASGGLIHESYFKDDPRRFTRPWFAWANSLFGELIGRLTIRAPQTLRL